MIKIHEFDKCELSGSGYGGKGGSKKGILLNGEKWLLKYPKSTKSMNVEGISYSTTPLSEYLGSHIYASIGIDVHDTLLGIADEKVVVACKDFRKRNEDIFDFNIIKNDYEKIIEEGREKLSNSIDLKSGHDFAETLLVINNNNRFKKLPKLKMRFWDMFIVDAFIGNHDRNDGNWGIIFNNLTSDISMAPVFDNGASFTNKSSIERMKMILSDDKRFIQSAYESVTSVYRINGVQINPLKFIEHMENVDCNEAVLRIVPNIDMNKIKEIFDNIPEEYDGYVIMDKVQKEFYLKLLEYRYENVLLPVYEKLKGIINENNNI